MPHRIRSRITVALSAFALVAAGLVPALPAAAEAPPVADPIVTESPSPEPTESADPEPTSSPDPEPTTEPTTEPTAEPTAEPTPTPTESAEPEPAQGETVSYVGAVNQISDEDRGDGVRSLPVFNVPGFGFLSIDTTGLGASVNLAGSVRLTFARPGSSDALGRRRRALHPAGELRRQRRAARRARLLAGQADRTARDRLGDQPDACRGRDPPDLRRADLAERPREGAPTRRRPKPPR